MSYFFSRTKVLLLFGRYPIYICLGLKQYCLLKIFFILFLFSQKNEHSMADKAQILKSN